MSNIFNKFLWLKFDFGNFSQSFLHILNFKSFFCAVFSHKISKSKILLGILCVFCWPTSLIFFLVPDDQFNHISFLFFSGGCHAFGDLFHIPHFCFLRLISTVIALLAFFFFLFTSFLFISFQFCFFSFLLF